MSLEGRYVNILPHVAAQLITTPMLILAPSVFCFPLSLSPTIPLSYLAGLMPLTDVRAPGQGSFMQLLSHITALLHMCPLALATSTTSTSTSTSTPPPPLTAPSPGSTANAANDDRLATDAASWAGTVDMLPCVPRATLSRALQHTDAAVRESALELVCARDLLPLWAVRIAPFFLILIV